MVLLEKTKSVFLRNDAGKLCPVLVPLKTIKGESEVEIIPLSLGEMKENAGVKDSTEQDYKIVSEHCVTPKYTIDEVKNVLKPSFFKAILIAILSVSLDVEQHIIEKRIEQQKDTIKAVNEIVKEIEVKKN